MRLDEALQSTRQFTLTVDEDELRLIENGLLERPSSEASGNTTNWSVWHALETFMDKHGVKRLEDQK